MASLSFRTFSGVTVGLVGSAIGIHRSLDFSTAVFFVVTTVVLAASGRLSVRARTLTGEPLPQKRRGDRRP